jgi:hypothetical protein
MSNSTPSIKGFHVSNRAHYARVIAWPEIMIGLYYPEGGCVAEFAIRWYDIGGRHRSAAKLEVFDDSWQLFFGLEELRGLAKFAKESPEQQKVIDLLLASGFRDLTQYEQAEPLNPYSVLLLYPDSDNEGGTETYLAHVHSADKKQAIMDAREEAAAINGWAPERGDEFVVLLVAQGHVTDIGEAA